MLESRAQRLCCAKSGRAVTASFEMALKFRGAHGVQFAVKISVKERARRSHSSWGASCCAGCVRARCKRWRARASADMTVPIGTLVIEAISLYEQPSSSRRYDYFPEAHGKRFERSRKPFAIVAHDGQSFRRSGRLWVQVFVEFSHELHLAIFLQPRIARIADDLQKPRAGVSAIEAAEKTKRAQHRFLRDVFCIGAASQQPTRKMECGIQMRQHELLEASPVLRIQHVPTFPLARRTHG